MDFGDDTSDDGARLVKDLKSHEKKLRAMAKKLLVFKCCQLQSQFPPHGWLRFNQLDAVAESADMDAQRQKIHEEASGLQWFESVV